MFGGGGGQCSIQIHLYINFSKYSQPTNPLTNIMSLYRTLPTLPEGLLQTPFHSIVNDRYPVLSTPYNKQINKNILSSYAVINIAWHLTSDKTCYLSTNNDLINFIIFYSNLSFCRDLLSKLNHLYLRFHWKIKEVSFLLELFNNTSFILYDSWFNLTLTIMVNS